MVKKIGKALDFISAVRQNVAITKPIALGLIPGRKTRHPMARDLFQCPACRAKVYLTLSEVALGDDAPCTFCSSGMIPIKLPQRLEAMTILTQAARTQRASRPKIQLPAISLPVSRAASG